MPFAFAISNRRTASRERRSAGGAANSASVSGRLTMSSQSADFERGPSLNNPIGVANGLVIKLDHFQS